ncbi:hypothetical protein [Marinobacterium arenosum]|uniref:hypothetical protein n=1 Tax=Marinobacterium arenosum TaxID=2862496 RepID=UPI001C966E06|nr:hypothetical protein [Marinobacterium arenosum]MBY4676103.1 hypothetical protein [Marinobacterium arenosum]
MTLLTKLFSNSSDQQPNIAASRVEARMSDEQKAEELARLKALSEQGPSEETREYFQQQRDKLRARGIPLRLVDKTDYEQRRARIAQRHHALAS